MGSRCPDMILRQYCATPEFSGCRIPEKQCNLKRHHTMHCAFLASRTIATLHRTDLGHASIGRDLYLRYYSVSSGRIDRAHRTWQVCRFPNSDNFAWSSAIFLTCNHAIAAVTPSCRTSIECRRCFCMPQPSNRMIEKQRTIKIPV